MLFEHSELLHPTLETFDPEHSADDGELLRTLLCTRVFTKALILVNDNMFRVFEQNAPMAPARDV